jgi:hypothetical protein
MFDDVITQRRSFPRLSRRRLAAASRDEARESAAALENGFPLEFIPDLIRDGNERGEAA